MIEDFLKFGYASIALVVVVGFLVGLAWGGQVGLIVAFIGLLILFLIHLQRLKRFVVWLEMSHLEPKPQARGVWDSIYSKVYKARKKTEKNEAKLEEKELRFRQTLSALPDGVVLTKKDWQIQWMNPIAKRDMQLSQEQDIGKNLIERFSGTELSAFLQSDRKEGNFIWELNSGKMLEVRVISAGKKYTVVVTRDVTESKRTDDFRRDFVANVSHELRTPLTVIKGFLELSEENASKDEEERLHWKMMREQADRMGALVDDLLRLSRLERDSAPAVRESVDVFSLLKEAAAEGKIVSRGRHSIEIGAVSGEHILADAKEMRSAVTNLVTNAVRYTPENGHIKLTWEAKENEGIITVSDDGIGIAPEDIPRVTERFYRVDKSRSRETGGTGLGLAIVKHVLFRHQANLQIDSELGLGSSFKIVIPKERIENKQDSLQSL